MAEFDPLRDVARHTYGTDADGYQAGALETDASLESNEIYTKELTILGTAVNPFTHPQAASPLQRLPLHEVRIATVAFDKATMPSRRLGLTDKIQLMSTWTGRA